MKRPGGVAIGFLWTLWFLPGCASLPRTAQTVYAPPADTDNILGVIGRFSIAHACPIGPETVITAAHVIDPQPLSNAALFGGTFEDGHGLTGFLKPDATCNMRDLGAMKPDAPLPKWYPLAAEGPKPGDKLYLRGWDWGSVETAFQRPSLEITFLRYAAGMIVVRESVEPGTSGSCVLNERGEVVGIMSFGKSVGKPSAEKQVAVIVSVFGSWGEGLLK